MVALISFLPLLWGCAAIVHGSRQTVTITSNPPKAEVEIKSINGTPMYTGTTPATVELKRKHEYNVIIKLQGYKDAVVPISKKLDGWVAGDVALLSLLGLIIDFYSGAAYKLDPDTISINLVSAPSSGNTSETIYAVFQARDAEGQLRTLAVPLARL